MAAELGDSVRAMMQHRLLALAVVVVGAASVPLRDQPVTPVAASRSPVPPVVWAFYRERQNATDNYSVTLYTNKAVGPGEWLRHCAGILVHMFSGLQWRECYSCTACLALAEAQCGLLCFHPQVSDSLKKAVLRLHVRMPAADRPTLRTNKSYQVRLCSVCFLDKCHVFAKAVMRPGQRRLEVEVPIELMKSKDGLRMRVSVIAKGRTKGELGAKQPSCEEAAIQFVTNDTQSVFAPVLLLYKESPPAFIRETLLPDLQTEE